MALLIENSRELDAQMVMRSLLEHLTLFAWLAIEPADSSHNWKARSPGMWARESSQNDGDPVNAGASHGWRQQSAV